MCAEDSTLCVSPPRQRTTLTQKVAAAATETWSSTQRRSIRCNRPTRTHGSNCSSNNYRQYWRWPLLLLAIHILASLSTGLYNSKAMPELSAATSRREQANDLFDPGLMRETQDAPLQQVKTSRKSRQKVVAFYNMYIPPNAGGQNAVNETVQALIQEQLGQVSSSYLNAQQEKGDPMTIYTIALGHKVSDEWLNRTCQSVDSAASSQPVLGSQPLQCQLLEHHDTGSEMITLTHLHDYCLSHPEHSVVYLHNKGSFHPDATQDRWRRSMTAAVTSRPCYESVVAFKDPLVTTSDACNTCGLLFLPLPGAHYSGNMWTAHCSYVAQLLAPNDFVALQNKLVNPWVEAQQKVGKYAQRQRLFGRADWTLGRNRYAAEHWVGSHYNVKPCDVSAHSRDIDYWRNVTQNYTAEFTALNQAIPAGRYTFDTPGWYFNVFRTKRNVLGNDKLRKYDSFLLRGLIFKWMTYYGNVPSDDSWVWTWFPDGAYWKERVHRLGAMGAVEAQEPYFRSFYHWTGNIWF